MIIPRRPFHASALTTGSRPELRWKRLMSQCARGASHGDGVGAGLCALLLAAAATTTASSAIASAPPQDGSKRCQQKQSQQGSGQVASHAFAPRLPVTPVPGSAAKSVKD